MPNGRTKKIVDMPGLDSSQIDKYIDDIPDEVLAAMTFSMPWQQTSESGTYKDPDGFDENAGKLSREKLTEEVWKKLHSNPQINTAVRGKMGRLTGWGFETTSEIFKIQEVIEEIELDPRNRLYNFWPKYIARTNVEGELFLCLTLHSSGFVEVDFIDPSCVTDGGDDDSGIIFHPTKTHMPLFFNVNNGSTFADQIPSIFIARYPELINIASKHKDFKVSKQKGSKTGKKAFKVFGGFYRFIVSWDKSFITRRAISYLRTTIEWLNHYENLKKYEIDHKKSSGAYLWIFKMTEPRAYKQWLKLSDSDKRKTAILAKKTPGSSLVLPPGMDVVCVNPNLTSIKDQDTDILQMVTSGLDEASDVTTGTSSGTFASVKASRGPMSDRTSDEAAYFERFLRYDFWGSVFFLKSAIGKFKEFIMVEEAVGFKRTGKKIPGTEDDIIEPVFRDVKKRPEMLIDISFPVSETVDYETRAKALMGTKHGPLSETVGLSKKEISSRLGFGGYGRQRLKKATEDRKYPALIYTADAESIQEKKEGNITESKSKPTDKKPKPNPKK